MTLNSVTDSEHLREVDPDVDDGLHLHLALDPGVAADRCLGVDAEVDVGPLSDPGHVVVAEHRLGVDPEVDVGPLSDPGHGMVAEHRPGVDPAVDVDLHPARIPDAAAADEDHRARTRGAACRSSAVSGGTRDWRGSDHPNSFQY